MLASKLMSPLYELYIRKSDVIEMRSMIPCAIVASPGTPLLTFVACRHYLFLASNQVFSPPDLQPTCLSIPSAEVCFDIGEMVPTNEQPTYSAPAACTR